MGIKVLVPDINNSDTLFKVENGNIRFALSAIKGVGEAGMRAITEEREKNGVFKSISDFIHRVDIKQMNRKQLEALIKAGAFDCLDDNRNKLFVNIENILNYMAASCELKTSAQSSLFGVQELSSEVKLKQVPDWPDLERLQQEAEAIGFYLSAHPLSVYSDSVERLGIKTYADVVKGMKNGDVVVANLAGCVQSFSKKISKKNNPFAIVKLSDESSSYEGLVFGDTYTQSQDILQSGLPLYVQAKIEKPLDDSPVKMVFNMVRTLDAEITENSKGLVIDVNDISAVRQIREILSHEHYGNYSIYIKPVLDDWDVRIQLKNGYALDNGNLLTSLRNLTGVSSVKEL